MWTENVASGLKIVSSRQHKPPSHQNGCRRGFSHIKKPPDLKPLHGAEGYI